MKPLSITVLLVLMLPAMSFVLTGCAVKQKPSPVMPYFETKEAKACGISCKATVTQCNLNCSHIDASEVTVSQRVQCFNNCNQILAECYSNCE